MPKVKITFDLNDFENCEKQALDVYLKAYDMLFALRDIAKSLREKTKFNDNIDEINLFESIKNSFYDILNSHGIDLDALE